MPSRFHGLPKFIPFYRIEKWIPREWRQNIKQSLDNLKKTKQQNNNSYSRIHYEIDDDMVGALVATLKGFACKGQLLKAFRTFNLIQSHALVSNSYAFVVDSLSFLLLSCTNLKLLQEGKQLHAQIITWGLKESHILIPKLVSYYAASSRLSDARFIVSRANNMDPLPWNILISSYVNKGHYEEAISLYKEMGCKRVRPDSFTYPSVIKACAELSNLELGREVHRSIGASPLCSDLFVQNALISMYGKCGDLESAKSIFDKMQIKDGVSWNSIVSIYANRGKWDEAFELFKKMEETGVNLNIIVWNTIAGGCLKTGNHEKALELICRMRMKINDLDPVAVIIGLGACSHIGALKQGKEIHALAIRNSSIAYENVENALITLYSRCGDLKHAYIIFRSMKAKNIVSWNSMISGFAHWDRSEEASFLFRELFHVNIDPNFVTLAAILPLCSRAANLQHGKEFHCYITKRKEFQGTLLLWNALTDMYARSGKVSLARKLFDMLEKRDASTYTSIIGGYGMAGKGVIALKLFEEMIRSGIEPDHIVMIAVLSACSHSGLVAQGQLLFKQMQTIYCITPRLEHFSCMVDLYGRAGLLKKARDVILSMPYKPSPELWATLLGACLTHGNTDIGEWAAGKLLETRPNSPGHYVLIANMYAAAGSWTELGEVRAFMRDLGVRKDPGCAWVDVGSGFVPFVVEDGSNSQADEIYLLLRGLAKHMRDIDSGDSYAEEEILLGLHG